LKGTRGFVVTSVEPDAAHYPNGERPGYDRLVGSSAYVAAERFPGLPADERGFIRAEPDSRRIKGRGDMFSVGYAADFPIKQAFLALLQAAAADHLAAEIKRTKPEVNFEPMSMCVMEELNKATFAQVPLKYTADLAKPVAVDTEDTEHVSRKGQGSWIHEPPILHRQGKCSPMGDDVRRSRDSRPPR
jgi:sulfide:quinone oxidoreductase